MPRGGRRTAGEGKKLGRPKGSKIADPRRPGRAVRLTATQEEAFDELRGDVPFSDAVRLLIDRAIARGKLD